MTEKTMRFSPETGKPEPVSVQEWFVMDRKMRGDFARSLSAKERFDFDIAVSNRLGDMTRAERQKLWKARREALAEKVQKTPADAVDLAVAAFWEGRLLLPEKPMIFLRKLRGPNSPLRSWTRDVKSPYLMP